VRRQQLNGAPNLTLTGLASDIAHAIGLMPGCGNACLAFRYIKFGG